MAYKIKIKKFDEIKGKIIAVLLDLKESEGQVVKDTEKLEKEAYIIAPRVQAIPQKNNVLFLPNTSEKYPEGISKITTEI